MKKLSLKAYITLVAVAIVIFNFTIWHYDFFPVIKKAASPVITGFVIAYLLDPMVRFITKLGEGKIRRGFAILISILLVIGFLVLFGAVMIPSIVSSAYDIVEKITTFVNEDFDIAFVEDFIAKIDSDIVNELIIYVQNSLKDILLKVGELSTMIMNGVISGIGSASSSLLSFFMAFVVAIYMLADKKDLLNRIKRVNYAVNEKETADELVRIAHKSDEIFSSFFVGKIIDSAIIGVLCFLLMWIFKIPNSPAIGFIIGITNIIPYFGPFIGAVPAVLVTLASGSFLQVGLVIILIIALQQFDGLYLGPKILGGKVGVGAFWIIVSVTAGGALYGVVGMFIGVPVVVLIKTLVEEYVEKKLKERNLEV